MIDDSPNRLLHLFIFFNLGQTMLLITKGDAFFIDSCTYSYCISHIFTLYSTKISDKTFKNHSSVPFS